MTRNSMDVTLSRRRLLSSAILGSMSLSLADMKVFGQGADGKKYALLVGVQKYDKTIMRPLSYAEKDMLAMGEVLAEQGFDVVVMTSQQETPSRVPMG